MKNIVSFWVILFAIAFSSQQLMGQKKPEEIAKMKVTELNETLELTGDQQRALWRAFVKKESAYARQVAGQDLSIAVVANAKNEIETTLDKEVKAILTSEQYKIYIASIEK